MINIDEAVSIRLKKKYLKLKMTVSYGMLVKHISYLLLVYLSFEA